MPAEYARALLLPGILRFPKKRGPQKTSSATRPDGKRPGKEVLYGDPTVTVWTPKEFAICLSQGTLGCRGIGSRPEISICQNFENYMIFQIIFPPPPKIALGCCAPDSQHELSTSGNAGKASICKALP